LHLHRIKTLHQHVFHPVPYICRMNIINKRSKQILINYQFV